MSTSPPNPRKKSSKPPNPVAKLVGALTQRLHHIVAVIDDALHSDNLKDRIWAVEQLLKRLKLDVLTSSSASNKKPKAPTSTTNTELAKLPADELERRLLTLLSSSTHQEE